MDKFETQRDVLGLIRAGIADPQGAELMIDLMGDADRTAVLRSMLGYSIAVTTLVGAFAGRKPGQVVADLQQIVDMVEGLG